MKRNKNRYPTYLKENKTRFTRSRIFEINKRLVDLSDPLISNEGKEEVKAYYEEELDPDGRGYKNLMRLMNDDGIFKYLPKVDDQWVEFYNHL